MTKALSDAFADTVAEMETKNLGETSTDVKAEELLYALADTVAEVQAQAI